jgi:hypothetical protein
VVVALAVVLVFSSLAWAQVPTTPGYTALPSASEASIYDSFARLQNATGDDGLGECAATSMINSFQYLEKAYPGTYGNLALTDDVAPGDTADLATVRDTLHSSIANPRLQGNVWTAKQNWINTNAPGTTNFAGITSFAPPRLTANGSVASQGYSTQSNNSTLTTGANGTEILAFLTAQIKAGEDVEIGLYQHMMTLIGVGTQNSNGAPAIEYIDPNSPGTDAWSTLTLDGHNEYTITIPGSGYGPPTTPRGVRPVKYSDTSEIYYAFAESPVPEPSTVVAISGLAFMGLVYRARRRKVFSGFASGHSPASC